MKWLLRIIPLLLLLPLLFLAAAWVFFPQIAPALLRSALEAPGRRIEIAGLSRPGFNSVGCHALTADVEVPPGPCTPDTAATLYHATIIRPQLRWDTDLSKLLATGKATITLRLTADSLQFGPSSGAFSYSDTDPLAGVEMSISLNGFNAPAFTPLAASYVIDDAALEAGGFKARGISVPLRASADREWVPEKADISIRSLENKTGPLPVTAIRASLIALPDSSNHCTLTLNRSSLELFGMKASTDTLAYDMLRKRAAFQLDIENADLIRLQGTKAGNREKPFATGVLHGSIPVVYADSVLRVEGAFISASKPLALHWYDRTVQEWLSIELGTGPVLRKLKAQIAVGGPEGTELTSLSAGMLQGTLKAKTARTPAPSGRKPIIVGIEGVDALQTVKFHGAYKGALKGRIYGTVPVTLEKTGFAIRNGTLRSEGGGTISIRDPKTGIEASYAFTEPTARFTRYPTGALTLDFSMRELTRKAEGGELLLTHPAGRALLWSDPASPDMVRLTNFSAGFFNSTLSITDARYDMLTGSGNTVLHFSSLPLQKLLDLQGTKKLYATGTLQGDIPVRMDKETIAIKDGGLRAEESGQIIYATTPEERAAANPGLRTTYEALTNFLYIQLASSLDMAPDGESLLTVQLKGNNPEYQGGRPVEINLTIRQNLLSLLKSLSIASDIERSISEKALRPEK
ncbi:intermembrane phospholipid transport protein YdbH family protein [Pelodictyon luteolum]|uniref:Dicarboxylate transport domain-containing protein n=1 Tax=Chlorobium luteolum (strain DSM 273 / BCRC 81028 / 2530) TaxID=319225 RepID=Q3B3U9_CHLL3|nr:YdbH domain-containing protein [Pelodictyon luteolum]ABB23982.1 conserved hypothetical protein [Pelodictyon luteolum DSM 273]